MLHNSAYLGLVPWRGKLYEGKHAPLIERSVYDAAQRILTERREQPGLRRRNLSHYVLSGVLRCKRCDFPYVGTYGQGTGGRYEYYRCRGRQLRGRGFCDNDILAKKPLENAVLAQLASLLSQTDLLERAWAEAQGQREADSGSLLRELKRAQELRLRVEKRRRRYFRAFEEGSLEATAFRERLAELAEELSLIEAREASLTADVEVEDTEFPRLAVEEMSSRLAAIDPEQNSAQAKALLRVLVAEIAVFGRDQIQPTYRLPLDETREAVRPMVGDGDSRRRRTGGARL